MGCIALCTHIILHYNGLLLLHVRLGLYIRQWDGEDATFLLPQLPDICSFQLSYSITIQQIRPSDSDTREENNIIVIGPKTVMDRTNVYEVVNSSLVVDAVYSVLVEFDTLAGNISSTTTFSKQSIVYCENTSVDYKNDASFTFSKLWLFFKSSICKKS